MNASKKYDIVDVHVTSSKYLVDSILEHPLLDGKKKYTVEITEFTVPLGGEPPLERQINFDTYDYLAFVRVFRKHTGEIPGVDDTLLRNVTDLGAALEQYELFKPDSVSKIQTPCVLSARIFRQYQSGVLTGGRTRDFGGRTRGGRRRRSCRCASGRFCQSETHPKRNDTIVFVGHVLHSFFSGLRQVRPDVVWLYRRNHRVS